MMREKNWALVALVGALSNSVGSVGSGLENFGDVLHQHGPRSCADKNFSILGRHGALCTTVPVTQAGMIQLIRTRSRAAAVRAQFFREAPGSAKTGDPLKILKKKISSRRLRRPRCSSWCLGWPLQRLLLVELVGEQVLTCRTPWVRSLVQGCRRFL